MKQQNEILADRILDLMEDILEHEKEKVKTKYSHVPEGKLEERFTYLITKMSEDLNHTVSNIIHKVSNGAEESEVKSLFDESEKIILSYLELLKDATVIEMITIEEYAVLAKPFLNPELLTLC